jgi:cytochrome c oxidase assembly protein subunit 15
MPSFRKLVFSTLVSVYVLILVGGIVRSSGSGMGCPDWPTCFGRWVPPTSVDQLPPDYKEFYAQYRHEKNVRFAKYLSAFGFSETANQILADESIREEADFNAVKTWIEYINRVVGVVIGFLIFAVFVYSIRFWKSHRSATLIAFLTFILVGFQGWLGSIVVSTNLTPWTITFHKLVAMLIVALLIYLMHRSNSSSSIPVVSDISMRVLLVVCIAALLVQVVLGTQVREAIDRVAAEFQDRNRWISALGMEFIRHRSFSWFILAINAFFLWKLWKIEGLNRFTLTVFLLILGTMFTGAGMAWFGIPPVLQPIHLLLATVTFGVEFLLLLRMNSSVNTELN